MKDRHDTKALAKQALRLAVRVGRAGRRSPSPAKWLKFARDALRLRKTSDASLPLLDLFPMLGEESDAAGVARGHYFHQDLWAARKVKESQVAHHVDVGSRIDGFVAHCSLFTPIDYVDLRPLDGVIPGVRFVQGSVLELPYESGSVMSLSSLHVIEHIGLGRYGDPIDPRGSERALTELGRVLAHGASLYIGCPIGRERVCFNAHRVLAPTRVLETLSDLALVSFSAVDDRGDFVESATPESFVEADYACGLYHLRRA
ncbi:MAG: DUF268 domain-containing protein [Myxococcota bacterium]